MLLIDGVKYELWTPPNEEEFERVVKEHTKEIFGEESLYLDLKQKLKSKSGVGSIPDGYVIVFGNLPCWHIIEVELSSHPLYEHIVQQTIKFINGIKNPYTQREITDAIFEEINSDDFVKLKVRRAIEPTETYRFLSDLISKMPVVTIIIEKHTEELDEALSTLAHPQVKIIEFQTFARKDVGLAVHAHLFEPLYLPDAAKVAVNYVKDKVVVKPGNNILEIVLRSPTFIKFHLFTIPKGKRRFFPGYKVPFKLETDIGDIETHVSSAPKGTQVGDPDAGAYIQAGLSEWYRRHPELKVGDKVVFEVIEPMKRYRLKKA